MILSEAIPPEALVDLTNTMIPSTLLPETLIEPTITVPSNDTSFKSKRLSQIQQKNNLRIVTSAEDLNELATAINLPTSSTTNTTNTDISNNISNSTGRNTITTDESTPSYLISKMSLMDNFNALNLNTPTKYKSPIHSQPHPHARSHRHDHRRHQSMCNSASVTTDNNSTVPLEYPLSAGLWCSNPNGPDAFDFSTLNSATASGPSTHSVPTSASVNTPEGIYSFNMDMNLNSRSSSHENLEVLSSNGSIHSTTRTSSSIVKKTKPIGYGMKHLHKKSSSLSKLNKSNSLLSNSESYDSSASASASSSSLQLNPDNIQALTLDPIVIADTQIQPKGAIDFLNLDIDNDDDIEYTGFPPQ